jgi:hypothetical protein
MYKVTLFRQKLTILPNVSKHSDDLEKHINEVAGLGWILVTAFSIGMYVTLIWKASE